MNRLIEGYRHFRESYEADHEVFDRLADEGQDPKVLWVGCSDSRVVPELITGAEPGELFNLRNIANVIPPSSAVACAAGAAVEYAVIHLGVGHIVVCGHTECGGIAALTAATDAKTQPHIDSWLAFARPARDRVLAAGVPEEARYLETIKTNVLLQLDHLRTYPCVTQGEHDGTLALHGWLYDLHDGTIQAYDPATTTWEHIARQRPGSG